MKQANLGYHRIVHLRLGKVKRLMRGTSERLRRAAEAPTADEWRDTHDQIRGADLDKVSPPLSPCSLPLTQKEMSDSPHFGRSTLRNTAIKLPRKPLGQWNIWHSARRARNKLFKQGPTNKIPAVTGSRSPGLRKRPLSRLAARRLYLCVLRSLFPLLKWGRVKFESTVQKLGSDISISFSLQFTVGSRP